MSDPMSTFWGDRPPGTGNVPGAAILGMEDVPQRTSPYLELGVTGLRRWSGYVDEEFLPALRGRKAVQIFKEMAENDAMVGALLFSIDMLIRAVEWHVQAASSAPADQQAAQFLEGCMEDMSHTWDDMISEVLSCLVYGWSWHEVVYKKRAGTNRNPELNSNFSDGLIGWRKIPIRAQETWLQWVFDAAGETVAMVQLAPPLYQRTVIPRSKSLLFRTVPAKNNPEGRSILRNAYRSWYFKKRLEEFEGIGIERDLAGLPVAWLPADYMNAPRDSPQGKIVESFRKMVRSVRRDEQEGVLMPLAFDEDTKQPLYKFELMTSGGARQFDTNTIINRYEQRILMTVLADFIMVGHQDTGSYALHVDKTGIFRAALNSIIKSVAAVFNRQEIPRLFALNGWNIDHLPELVPTDVDPPDLTQLGQFINQMTAAGMTFFPDQDLEAFLRDTAKLPPVSPEVEAERIQQQNQDQAMQIAQQQMQLQGQQQALDQGQQQGDMAAAQGAQQLDQGQQSMAAQMQQMDHAERGQARADAQEQRSANEAKLQSRVQLQNLRHSSAQASQSAEAHKMTMLQQMQAYREAQRARNSPNRQGPGQGSTTGNFRHKR
jgi:hypothetical protein